MPPAHKHGGGGGGGGGGSVPMSNGLRRPTSSGYQYQVRGKYDPKHKNALPPLGGVGAYGREIRIPHGDRVPPMGEQAGAPTAHFEVLECFCKVLGIYVYNSHVYIYMFVCISSVLRFISRITTIARETACGENAINVVVAAPRRAHIAPLVPLRSAEHVQVHTQAPAPCVCVPRHCHCSAAVTGCGRHRSQASVLLIVFQAGGSR